MAINKQDSLDLVFGALADPTRRAILARLALGDADVSELMKPFHLSQPASWSQSRLKTLLTGLNRSDANGRVGSTIWTHTFHR
jgi:hypothetical protein